jgi:hypothetical protein
VAEERVSAKFPLGEAPELKVEVTAPGRIVFTGKVAGIARPSALILPLNTASEVELSGMMIRTTPEESPEGQLTPGAGPLSTISVETKSWASTI